MIRTLRLKIVAIACIISAIISSCTLIDDIKKELYVKISTDNVSYISYTVAVVGGNIIDDGGKTVTERGVCYSTSPNPTTANDKKLLGGGLGAFQTPLDNLKDNTTYYLRAYCVNAYGTSYGDEKSFKTLQIGLPTVTTASATNIKSSQFTISLNVSSNGGSNVIVSGFVYSLNPNVTLSDQRFQIPNSFGINTPYSATITGLMENTTYYVAAYSRNAKGEVLGNIVAVKTAESQIKVGLANGLQVFYPFNGNANDVAGKNFNGVSTGVTLVADRFSQPNSAYLFGGSSKIITNYLGISGYNPRTISLWFKIPPNSLGNHSHLISFGGNPFLDEPMFSIFVSTLGSPKPYIALFSYGYVGNQFANLQDNQWHHIAAVVDGTNQGKLSDTKMYIDGIKVNYDVFYNDRNVNNILKLPLTIGQFTSLDSDPRNFGGSLDDIGIWNRALSETEIQYLYLNNYKP